jgi:enterochelin esterase-like enzyme
MLARRAGLVAVLVGLATACGRARTGDASGDALARAIAEVEAGRRTTPLIVQPAGGGDALVTFLAEITGEQAPRVVSDVTGWGENVADGTFDLTAGTMTRVGSTSWYRLEAQVAPGARVEYLIVHGVDYGTDPHNPRQAPYHGAGPVSEFVTLGYVPPRALLDPPGTPAGTTSEVEIASRALHGSRRAIVYTPAGYRRDRAYPLAVFHDGWAAAREGDPLRVLDWLIAHGTIEPLVAVFLASTRDEDVESHQGAPLRAFLTEEVPAWVASRYGVTTRADERAILAISYGAKDALDAALAPAGTYGRLGLLIPGRRLRHADLEAVAGLRDRRLRVAILAGRYDAANIATARDARAALAAAGHVVEYIEVPEGHNPATWRNHLGDVMVRLFGTARRP